jgi:glycine/D-amino acid oxidase-like deaminating enzyme
MRRSSAADAVAMSQEGADVARDVAVIGAGVVGMACARALQRAGQRVVVYDPEPPGSGCSHGNAGVIAGDHVLPLSRPDVLVSVPRMLGDPEAPLYLRPRRLVGLAPWLAQLAWAGRPRAVERGSRALSALVSGAVAAWRDELASCGASALLATEGSYVAYDTPRAYQRHAPNRRAAHARAVPLVPLRGRELAARLPALTPVYRGIHYPDNAHVLNPRAVVEAMAVAFQRAGGRLEPRRVAQVARAEGGAVVVVDGRRETYAHVVIAAGWQSAALCDALDRPLPLGVEMGYHVTFDLPAGLAAPVMMARHGFMVTPMAGELRIAGTVEFARAEEAPDWRRAAVLERQARRLFRVDLGPVRDRWRGSRPTLPDFLPAIGPLTADRAVLAAFGHQHIGLTSATVTARLVTDLVLGRQTSIDPTPYSPDRFS